MTGFFEAGQIGATCSDDLLDRLSPASRSGLTQGSSYDANGNRLSQTGTVPSGYMMAAGNA